SCGDDSDVAEVPETLFEESTGQKEKQSEYPFGFTPNDDTNEFCVNEENVRSVNDDNLQNCNVDEIQTGKEGNNANKGSKVDVTESVCSGHFKKSEAPQRESSEYVRTSLNCANSLPSGKANVVTDALRQKEREKVTKIHSLRMIVTADLFERIKAAQVDVLKEENWKSECITSYIPHFKDDSQGIKTRQGRIYIPFRSNVNELPLEEAHKRCQVPVCWDEVGSRELASKDVVLATTKKIKTIRERLKEAQDRWKSYADNRRRPIEFNVWDFVMLKRVGEIAYVLELPEEMRGIHNTFHVSYLRKFIAEESSVITLDDVDIEPEITTQEPMAILERKLGRLRNKEITLVKVQWKHRKGTSIRWEPEEKMRTEYPRLFQE
nr:hypothetical protein [Tanacetum cinerariifolium]